MLEGDMLSVSIDRRGILEDVLEGALDVAFSMMLDGVLALLPSA